MRHCATIQPRTEQREVKHLQKTRACRFSSRSLTALCALLFAPFAFGLSPCLAQDAVSCRELLRDALSRHHAHPDSGVAVRRTMHVTTVRKIGERLDTVVKTVETLEWNGGNVVRSEGIEVWSDEQTLIMIEERTKRIRFVDLGNKQRVVAAQGQFGVAFPDSLIAYGRSFECEEVRGKKEVYTRVTFAIDSAMQRFFNAISMTVEVDQGGEIVRMSISHPLSSPIRTTDYVVDEVDRTWTEPGVPGSVHVHFIDESGKLKSEFSDYRVSR